MEMGEVPRKLVTSTAFMEVKHGSQGKISNIRPLLFLHIIAMAAQPRDRQMHNIWPCF